MRALFRAAHSPPAKIAAKAKGAAQNRGATRWACVKLQVTPTGAPEQEIDTDPTKLLLLPNARLKVAVCPAATVADVLPLAVNANVAGAFTVTEFVTLVLVPEASVKVPVTV